MGTEIGRRPRAEQKDRARGLASREAVEVVECSHDFVYALREEWSEQRRDITAERGASQIDRREVVSSEASAAERQPMSLYRRRPVDQETTQQGVCYRGIGFPPGTQIGIKNNHWHRCAPRSPSALAGVGRAAPPPAKRIMLHTSEGLASLSLVVAEVAGQPAVRPDGKEHELRSRVGELFRHKGLGGLCGPILESRRCTDSRSGSSLRIRTKLLAA